MKKEKRSKLLKLMEQHQLDGVFIHSHENLRYLTGFTGSNGVYYFDGQDDYLWTDQRYTLQANEQSPFCKIEVADKAMNHFFSLKLPERLRGRIGFESDLMTVSHYKLFSSFVPDIEWIPLGAKLLEIRAVKSSEELAIIKQAVQIADDAFDELLPMIQIGMTEMDVRNELEYLMLKGGHEGPAFGTIVAFGERAALPHAVPTNRKLQRDEFLLIDFGVNFNGYMSDMTRTIAIGEVDSYSANVFNLTLQALEKSIAAIKPGIESHQLDQVARNVFEESDMEEYSLRGLGHGVGLQIHELPRIVQFGSDIVAPGMVFTVEPGLYIPNRVGVRIEDLIHVTEEGCDVLTDTPRKISLSL
ncbi:M24 family metallopeptidase [Sporosarcina sp. OR05]|uniref:M24 family metallopeptidase n=1 Tax=Sporosarcina sp. OR05 TaxID=2969819 RepID=UPI003529E154